MFLTEANVLHYLLARRFARPENVVEGAFEVCNLSRRNRNYRVTCGPREYLVKQTGKWDYSGRSTIEREAALYRQARTDSRYQPLRSLAPESYSYDPANAILIFEFLPDDTPLLTAPARLLPETGRAAGRAMARFHADMRLPELAAMFPVEPPTYFAMSRWSVEGMEDATDGQRELVRLVQRHRDFGPALASLAADWRAETTMHGDWKVDNCLLASGGASLHVIDWELAGWGDPVWDVATLLESWWCLWLQDAEENPLEQIQPVLRAFLDAYIEESGIEESGVERAQFQQRAMAFAAARMLQNAWESLQKTEDLEPLTVLLAQASLNLLTRPAWGAAQILGADA
jgi:Ser/Thr protein kinase RdoA (MazF antagonist)